MTSSSTATASDDVMRSPPDAAELLDDEEAAALQHRVQRRPYARVLPVDRTGIQRMGSVISLSVILRRPLDRRVCRGRRR